MPNRRMPSPASASESPSSTRARPDTPGPEMLSPDRSRLDVLGLDAFRLGGATAARDGAAGSQRSAHRGASAAAAATATTTTMRAKNGAGECMAGLCNPWVLIPTALDDDRHPEAAARLRGPRRMAANTVHVAILRGSLRSHLRMT